MYRNVRISVCSEEHLDMLIAEYVMGWTLIWDEKFTTEHVQVLNATIADTPEYSQEIIDTYVYEYTMGAMVWYDYKGSFVRSYMHDDCVVFQPASDWNNTICIREAILGLGDEYVYAFHNQLKWLVRAPNAEDYMMYATNYQWCEAALRVVGIACDLTQLYVDM